MTKLTLYHGSYEIIEKPLHGKCKSYNDYGRGFYCTEHIELAKEWACTKGIDGYVSQYTIDTSGLKILNLSSVDYSILHWLALLMHYRIVRVSTPMMKQGVAWLEDNFLIDISEYDIVIGYRADDSYFSFARAFVNNEISLKQLSYSMKLGELGEQVVLKSEKAFNIIQYISYVTANNSEYYVKRKARDEGARIAYKTEVENDDINGIYIRDIIREEVEPNDPRLRQ